MNIRLNFFTIKVICYWISGLLKLKQLTKKNLLLLNFTSALPVFYTVYLKWSFHIDAFKRFYFKFALIF